ncbi:MAG: COX15/CtaA family protein [Saprospiraceae bacterium]|nr:COX15/CtaA family protein [Saprospiraceae bacterium]
MNHSVTPLPRPVRIWLLIGLIMVFFQVIIGGVTRLTDSGLSITEWSVIQGTLPPMNEADWTIAFEMYQSAAKKQFESLHADMTLSEFKVIYFWEYFHRLWARTIGMVFLLPFLFFLWKKWMPKWLVRRLGIVILLASLTATFGWIMVKSGLNDDNRTWVSAYKLIVHLALATTLFGYMCWTWFMSRQPFSVDSDFVKLKSLTRLFLFVLFVQILFGGLMAGMRAGVIHPYFPLFVQGDRLWGALTNTQGVNVQNFIDYEPSIFLKAWVQVIHRLTAYLLIILGTILFLRIRKSMASDLLKKGNVLLISMLIIQFLLGVLTVINSFGRIPVNYGVFHQGGALILLSIVLYLLYQFRSGNQASRGAIA